MSESSAASHRAAAGLSALAGLAAFLVVHLGLVLGWDAIFSTRAWPGYEEAMRRGMVEPWFVHSPAALWFTRAVLFAAALGLALSRGQARWRAAFAFWFGSAIGVAFAWATTTLRTLPWGWLGFVFYPLRVALPIAAGTAVAELVHRLRRSNRNP